MNISNRWQALVRILLFFISSAVVLAATSPMAPAGPGMMRALLIGTIAGLGALVLSFLFVRWEGIRLEDIGAWPGRQTLIRLAVGFVIGLLIVALHSSITGLVGHVRWVRAPGVSFSETTITLIAFVALSCREELAFHGYPLRRLERLFGLWAAQLIVAVVFAAEHVAGGATWGQAFAGPGVGSLLFGMASIATKGLAVPVGIHAAWNFGDWMRGGKNSIGFWKAVVESGFEERAQFIGMFSYVLVMLSATLAFWWWHRTSKVPT